MLRSVRNRGKHHTPHATRLVWGGAHHSLRHIPASSHCLGHTVSDTRSRTHGLGHTVPDAWSRTHGLGHTASDSRSRTHGLGLAVSDNGLGLLCSFSNQRITVGQSSTSRTQCPPLSSTSRTGGGRFFVCWRKDTHSDMRSRTLNQGILVWPQRDGGCPPDRARPTHDSLFVVSDTLSLVAEHRCAPPFMVAELCSATPTW